MALKQLWAGRWTQGCPKSGRGCLAAEYSSKSCSLSQCCCTDKELSANHHHEVLESKPVCGATISSCFVSGRLLITEGTLLLRTHSSSLPFTITTKYPRISPLISARLRHIQMPSLCTVIYQCTQNYTLIISGLLLYHEQT